MIKYYLIGEKQTGIMRKNDAELSYWKDGKWVEEPKLLSYLMDGAAVEVSETQVAGRIQNGLQLIANVFKSLPRKASPLEIATTLFKYDDSQPRAPAGSSNGGQWVSEGGSGGATEAKPEKKTKPKMDEDVGFDHLSPELQAMINATPHDWKWQPGKQQFVNSKTGQKISVKHGLKEKKLTEPLPQATEKEPDNSNYADYDKQKFSVEYYTQIAEGLPDVERNAVTNYTGSYYGSINGYLRGKLDSAYPSSATLARIANIDAAIEKSSLREDTMLYRGIRSKSTFAKVARMVNDGTIVGATIEDKAFVSTSASEKFARWWVTDGVAMHIRAPKGSNALYVEAITQNSGEKEFMLPRNSKFVVRSFLKREKGKDNIKIGDVAYSQPFVLFVDLITD